MTGADHLLVLGNREAIYWVLDNQVMAFPGARSSAKQSLMAGDRLFLYATRGAWKNPTRDRGRVFGTATVASPILSCDPVLRVADRDFPRRCQLRIDVVAPYPNGVVLADLVDLLHVFPKKHAWSVYLRTTVLPIDTHDARIIERRLAPLLVPREDALDRYRAAAKVGR